MSRQPNAEEIAFVKMKFEKSAILAENIQKDLPKGVSSMDFLVALKMLLKGLRDTKQSDLETERVVDEVLGNVLDAVMFECDFKGHIGCTNKNVRSFGDNHYCEACTEEIERGN